MTEPVVVTAAFQPAEGKHDEAVAALSAAIAEVHTEEGCLLYAIHEVPDGSIFMIEKWTSAELLAAHAAGEAVARLNASLEGLLVSPPVVTTMAPIPAGTNEQGQL